VEPKKQNVTAAGQPPQITSKTEAKTAQMGRKAGANERISSVKKASFCFMK